METLLLVVFAGTVTVLAVWFGLAYAVALGVERFWGGGR